MKSILARYGAIAALLTAFVTQLLSVHAAHAAAPSFMKLDADNLVIREPGMMFLLGLALIALVVVQRRFSKSRKQDSRADT